MAPKGERILSVTLDDWREAAFLFCQGRGRAGDVAGEPEDRGAGGRQVDREEGWGADVTMSPEGHYRRAEALLDEGEAVVRKIGELADARDDERDDDYHAYLTRRMDELGKKAMGIWAQAQAHATLATLAPWPGKGDL